MKAQFVQHRLNRIAELQLIPADLGCEIDIRSNVTTGNLHLSHDPFVIGDNLDAWLRLFAHKRMRGPLILNTKEDGLEEAVHSLLRKHAIQNFFFLDTTMPTLLWMSHKGFSDFALRLSQFEPGTQFDAFVGRVQWIYIDCFDHHPLAKMFVERWAGKFKLCLASPELHGGSNIDFSKFMDLANLCDAICTKHPRVWRERGFSQAA